VPHQRQARLTGNDATGRLDDGDGSVFTSHADFGSDSGEDDESREERGRELRETQTWRAWCSFGGFGHDSRV